MGSIAAIAEHFFVACKGGHGWDVCKAYCTPDATFTAQAEPLCRCENARTVHRLDEAPADASARRAVRCEILRY